MTSDMFKADPINQLGKHVISCWLVKWRNYGQAFLNRGSSA